MIKIRYVLFITLLISFQIFSGQKSTIEEVIDKITQKQLKAKMDENPHALSDLMLEDPSW